MWDSDSFCSYCTMRPVSRGSPDLPGCGNAHGCCPGEDKKWVPPLKLLHCFCMLEQITVVSASSSEACPWYVAIDDGRIDGECNLRGNLARTSFRTFSSCSSAALAQWQPADQTVWLGVIRGYQPLQICDAMQCSESPADTQHEAWLCSGRYLRVCL